MLLPPHGGSLGFCKEKKGLHPAGDRRLGQLPASRAPPARPASWTDSAAAARPPGAVRGSSWSRSSCAIASRWRCAAALARPRLARSQLVSRLAASRVARSPPPPRTRARRRARRCGRAGRGSPSRDLAYATAWLVRSAVRIGIPSRAAVSASAIAPSSSERAQLEVRRPPRGRHRAGRDERAAQVRAAAADPGQQPPRRPAAAAPAPSTGRRPRAAAAACVPPAIRSRTRFRRWKRCSRKETISQSAPALAQQPEGQPGGGRVGQLGHDGQLAACRAPGGCPRGGSGPTGGPAGSRPWRAAARPARGGRPH